MSFDVASYIMGHAKGEADGQQNIVIEGNINCADPNNDGNVVITEG